MPTFTRSIAVAVMLILVVACASPVAAKKDRPDRLSPTACTVAPRTASDDTTATPLAEPPVEDVQDSDEGADSPAGEPAISETVAQITAVAQEFAGCFNAADESRLAALMTDRAVAAGLDLGTFVPVFAEVGTNEADGTLWEVAWLRVRNVRELPDGRVSAVVGWGMTDDPQLPPIAEPNVHVFAPIGDRWLLDEKLSAAAPDIDPVLGRGQEGFSEVDSTLYAEPTMAGARFSIGATVMVGFLGNDDLDAVSCEMFIFERGDDEVTTSAFCRTEDSLLGRAAYLDVEVSGPHRGSESAMSRCEDAALLASSMVFSCTVDIPQAAP